ncbi:MAG: trypsin-like peptidase domain-containing protein [Deltaproteobacteria bacterium]|nr:trypsin-like peptidase domain-containing protein [Deltaproteobacteria bacterium]
MFANAIEKTGNFIRPVVVTRRYYDERVETIGGTIVILNKNGWFISAAHIFEAIALEQNHKKDIEDYQEKAAKFKDDPNLRKELKRLRPNPRWVTACSVWPGEDKVTIEDISVIPDADLFLGRLDPFDPSTINQFPIFKEAEGVELPIGTPLCKTGFSYTDIDAKFDKATGAFALDLKNMIPFPLDGIYTRNILMKSQKDAKESEERDLEIKFIETSTPGLLGHSGAPVFDADGTLWGIHSRTTHLPLGFSPSLTKETKFSAKDDTLSVGWAIHTELICKFLKERGISFESAS